jgi:hypothetical protein
MASWIGPGPDRYMSVAEAKTELEEAKAEEAARLQSQSPDPTQQLHLMCGRARIDEMTITATDRNSRPVFKPRSHLPMVCGADASGNGFGWSQITPSVRQ